MQFTDLDSFTYIGNTVIVNGNDRKVQTMVNSLVKTVQFHRGRDYLLEEGTNTKVPFSKYQFALDEWVVAEVTPPTEQEQYEANPVDYIEKAIDAHLDSVAMANGFPSGLNAIGKFVGYDNSKRLVAESLGAWCANVWDFAEAELAKVELGTRTLPDTMEEVIAELPLYS